MHIDIVHVLDSVALYQYRPLEAVDRELDTLFISAHPALAGYQGV